VALLEWLLIKPEPALAEPDSAAVARKKCRS
jgi:hypothetical protein